MSILKIRKGENKMNVLSLFDGISCGQVAFDRLGVTFDKLSADDGHSNAERERERVIITLLVK